MSETKLVSTKDLKLDLTNYRTVPQPDEVHAVLAMISIGEDRFWALMDSILEDGYLPTENILVLRSGTNETELVVKEGNRRVAALKLIYGYLSDSSILLPNHIRKKIDKLSDEWKLANEGVPCTIYDNKDAALVDKIVTLTHGKGDKASRDQWTAVARARHNRDVNNVAEPGLDLLEKYLTEGENILPSQSEQWAGEYNLTVLNEMISRFSTRFGANNAPDLVKKYPTIQYREVLEGMLHHIGLEVIGFKAVRNETELVDKYGLPPATPGSSGATGGTKSKGNSNGSTGASNGASGQSQGSQGASAGASGNGAQGGAGPGATGKKTAAAINDPKAVIRQLKKFKPLGNNRAKVVALRDEAVKLDLVKTPMAFCFLLRSMFEISAKAYSADHPTVSKVSLKKANGKDKTLVELLGDISDHLSNNQTDKAMTKVLHGAMTELGKPEGILSVTSMNQLVHNPSFSITPSDISMLFGNIYPLLELMNR